MAVDMLKQALAYMALGWYVFPLAVRGEMKIPHPMLGKRIEGGPPVGMALASIKPEQAHAWWGPDGDPQAGIAVNLKKSGLFAVDVDPRNGGRETLARLEAIHGKLEPALHSLTGGGGDHLIYYAPDDLKAAPGRMGPPGGGVDIKWDGYIVLPPSRWNRRDPETKVWGPAVARYKWAPKKDPRSINVMGDVPAWVLTASESGSRALTTTGSSEVAAHDGELFGVNYQTKADLGNKTIEQWLAGVPNVHTNHGGKFDYWEWLYVLFAIWHQTDGSAEGRQAAYDWSASSMEHHDDYFDKKWGSAEFHDAGNKKAITFRLVIKWYNEFQAEEIAEQVADLKKQVAEAATLPDMAKVQTLIRHTAMPMMQRDSLAALCQKQIKKVEDYTPTIGSMRAAVKYEDPDKIASPDWISEGKWHYAERPMLFFRLNVPGSGIKKDAFGAKFDRKMITRQERLDGIAIPEVGAVSAALNRYQIPTVHDLMYYPNQAEIFEYNGLTYANTYSEIRIPEPPDWYTKAQQDAVNAVEAHFRTVLCPNPGEADIVLAALAYVAQTRERLNWAIVLQGAEAIGKTWVTLLLGVLVGPTNVKTTSPEDVMHPTFTSWGADCLFNVIEEIRIPGHNRYAIINRLKPYITNATVTINEKNTPLRLAVNTVNWWCCTNDRDALPLGEGDTRYFMVSSDLQTAEQVEEFKKANPDWYGDIHNAVYEHAGAVRKFFLEYRWQDVKGFDPTGRAPPSQEHAHAVAIAKNETLEMLEDILEEASGPFLCAELLSTIALAAEFVKRTEGVLGSPVTPPKTRSLEWVLIRAGFTFLDRCWIDNVRHRFWTKTPRAFSKDIDERRAQIRARGGDHGL